MSTTAFSVTSSGKLVIDKDPDAVLDYAFLWENWLEVGEEIQSQITVVENNATGYVQSAFIHQGTSVVVFLAGGTVGERLTVRCRIFTTQGRLEDRTIYVKIKQH